MNHIHTVMVSDYTKDCTNNTSLCVFLLAFKLFNGHLPFLHTSMLVFCRLFHILVNALQQYPKRKYHVNKAIIH